MVHTSHDLKAAWYVCTVAVNPLKDPLMSTRTLLITTFTIALTSLTGCHLYLDGEGDEDSPPACRGDGCSGPGSLGLPDGGFGFSCEENADCAAGCYCDEGSCQEAGFCEVASDCANDFTCDDRSSCVPEPEPEPTCQGEITNCYTVEPSCSEDTTAVIVDGCYTGSCMPREECPDGAPLRCEDRADEASCSADISCQAVYRGINCTSPSGAECTSGMTDCSCESFVFDRCEA